MPEDVIEKYVKEIEWIKDKLLPMDGLCNPLMGIKEWDDSVIVEFGNKKLVASADGPYTKRLVLKSALIHASTDVVVKGGRPLFTLDTIIGPRKDIEEMMDSLKRQAEQMKIPILGGNTLIEDCEPRCSLTVVGEMLLDRPIRDSGAEEGDVIALLGEPIWGEQADRIQKALKLFNTWYDILEDKVKINSAKDVTKGGIISVVYEMEKKSKHKFKLKKQIPFSLTRNLDNFLLTLPEPEYKKLEKQTELHECSLEKIGVVE